MSRRTRKHGPAPVSSRNGSAKTPPQGSKAARHWVPFGAAATALLLLAGGVWWSRARPDARREAGLSVLLITVDTLRADAVGAYGNARAVTPWMDRLAASGVRFDDAHAHNVVTLPSHANILSGRYPLDHAVRDNAGFRFPRGQETLATLLRARGYRTAAFVSAFPVDSRFGLARGFDVYEDSFTDAQPRPAFLEQERRGTETVALARRWLEAQRGAPSLCWVHIYEPHSPYEPPEPFASRFRRDPYHGEVAAADAALGPLLEPLLAAGSGGRTLVVLTSDHGESLGEHGEATHGLFAYEATLRVPLILHQPRLLEPRIVSQPARHVDVLPTILDALSSPIPEGLPGHSLLAAAAGGPVEAATSYFEALSGTLNRGWAPLHGVIRGRMKYVELPIPELYDLRSDPQETHNLAATEPPRLDELRALLAPLLDADRRKTPTKESADTRERLRSLGYLTPGAAHPKGSFSAEDDPKRLLELDALLQEVVRSYGEGDLPGALARCRDLVRRRPGMTVGLLHLAQLERENGNVGAGVAALRSAVALAPGDTTALSLLGTYLTQAGRAREAVDLLAPYVRRQEPDVDVVIACGLALARLGRTQEALATLARAREADPSNAQVLVDIGTVHLMREDRRQAREAFEAALAQNPGLARAWSSLGVIAAEDARVEEALERWKHAVALDAREFEKLLAIGSLLRQRGRTAEARVYLDLFARSAPEARHARDIEAVRSWLARSGAR